MSYGAFGMCLGLALVSHDLQYGMHGLKAIINSTHSFALSTDRYKIFHFLELNPQTFDEGFEDYTQLIEYILACPYVDARAFLRSLVRPRRGARHDLVEAAERIMKNQKEQEPPPPILARVKERALAFFDTTRDYDECVNRIDRDAEKKRVIQEKFNGRIVQEMTNLEGKELGAFMAKFRNQYPNLLDLPADEIRDCIMKCFRVL